MCESSASTSRARGRKLPRNCVRHRAAVLTTDTNAQLTHAEVWAASHWTNAQLTHAEVRAASHWTNAQLTHAEVWAASHWTNAQLPHAEVWAASHLTNARACDAPGNVHNTAPHPSPTFYVAASKERNQFQVTQAWLRYATPRCTPFRSVRLSLAPRRASVCVRARRVHPFMAERSCLASDLGSVASLQKQAKKGVRLEDMFGTWSN
eukprot:360826-Chlamydomonas_euryale.AAC.2